MEPDTAKYRSEPTIKAPTQSNRTPFGTNGAPGMENAKGGKTEVQNTQSNAFPHSLGPKPTFEQLAANGRNEPIL